MSIHCPKHGMVAGAPVAFGSLACSMCNPRSPDECKRESDRSGLKLDDGKLRYDLVDPRVEAEMVAVLTYGAEKYEAWNWVKVEKPIERYTAALRRHLAAFLQGEAFDPETGLHHLAHLACCAHFMLGCEINEAELIAAYPLAERLAKALVVARRIRAERDAR